MWQIDCGSECRFCRFQVFGITRWFGLDGSNLFHVEKVCIPELSPVAVCKEETDNLALAAIFRFVSDLIFRWNLAGLLVHWYHLL